MTNTLSQKPKIFLLNWMGRKVHKLDLSQTYQQHLLSPNSKEVGMARAREKCIWESKKKSLWNKLFNTLQSRKTFAIGLWCFTVWSQGLSHQLPDGSEKPINFAFLKLEFTPCKTKQQLRGMELQEKEAQKD